MSATMPAAEARTLCAADVLMVVRMAEDPAVPRNVRENAIAAADELCHTIEWAVLDVRRQIREVEAKL